MSASFIHINNNLGFRSYLIILFLFVVLPCQGQNEDVNQDIQVNEQFWLDYNFTRSKSDNRDLTTQIGFRTISPHVYNRFVAISTGNFLIESKNKWISLLNSYHLGTGVIYTHYLDDEDNFELRFSQGVRFDIPTMKLVTLNNYVRLEERIQTTFNGDVSFGLRLRYKLSTVIAWDQHLLQLTEGLYFPLETEVFINLTKAEQFNDVLRLTPGIGYRIKSGWRFEFYLMFNRNQNITDTSGKTSDFIFRFRIRDDRQKKVHDKGLFHTLIDGVLEPIEKN